MRRWFFRLNLLAVLLCLALVALGAYVRLSDAGLGCPDWPGCYGDLTVPQAPHALARAEARFGGVVEAGKAWKEMIHRYLAGVVGLLVLALAIIAASSREVPRRLTFATLAVLVAQIVFGALTVTWRVMPIIVTTHLLLGLTTLALLWWMWLRQSARPPGTPAPRGTARWALLGLGLLIGQIFLGGWTSTNYAALGCPDFPTCHGQWWPATDYAAAFRLWHGLGVDYEGGVLDSMARTTIHLTHRLGALAVTVVLGALALYLLWRAHGRARTLGLALLAALVLQLTIGISLIESGFPLWLADAHNVGAALLLLAVVAVNEVLWRTRLQPAPARTASRREPANAPSAAP
ncbi:MAG: COX15/CtaA family protein [Gammaproteobacteria bacterium]|nr:COX15/CtaA family protein [Gammaproteobacteria bacterium]